MMGVKEAGVRDLEAVKNRALKSRAMGRIDQTDCDHIVGRVDDLIGYVLNMNERDKEEE